MAYETNANDTEILEKEEEILLDFCTILKPAQPTKKRLSAEDKVENRRKVEEILFDKQYQEVYGDPFEELH